MRVKLKKVHKAELQDHESATKSRGIKYETQDCERDGRLNYGSLEQPEFDEQLLQQLHLSW